MTTATPWAEPVRVGPTWRRGEDGKFVIPALTLGWHVVGWTRANLQHPDGSPWRYTREQFRLTLWWYAVDETGRFVFRDGVVQRLKGWGKDPLIATWAAVEFVGPCRPTDGLATPADSFGVPEGQPLGTQHPAAWVQIAAVSKDQTRNTMTLFPGLFTKRALEAHSIDLGKEIIYADKGRARIEAVTSSPRTLEGGRSTFVVRNETHHWLANNDGHEMDAVIDRNVTKSADGQARAVSITNAYEPGEDSVAERAREAYELIDSGRSLASGILYDSLEAHPDAPLTPDAAPTVIDGVRGDSTWLDVDRIVQAILDPRNPPSRSRRFWYNQVVAAEDAWLDPAMVDLLEDPGLALWPDEEIAAFFDGSKSDDVTGLVACRISDGVLFKLGGWGKPPKWDARRPWQVPRGEVDARVDWMFTHLRVVAFYADPSHALDDDGERFWDGVIDGWHQRHSAKVDPKLWAVRAGDNRSAFLWDMTSPERTSQFTAAAERFVADVDDKDVQFCSDAALKQHLKNARRRPNRYGISIGKEHRESPRKIDLAVCAVGARMLRRVVLNLRASTKQRTGEAVFI